MQSREEVAAKAQFDEVMKEIAEDRQDFHVPDLTLDKFLGLAMPTELLSKKSLTQLGEALGNRVRNIFRRSSFLIHPPREPTGVLAFYTTGMLFSAFHIVAWNWEFPSSTVRMLWRIFGLAATSIGPFTFLFGVIVVILDDFASFFVSNIITQILLISLLLVYVISRIGLVVLVFYCFSSMPAGVYKTVNWV